MAAVYDHNVNRDHDEQPALQTQNAPQTKGQLPTPSISPIASPISTAYEGADKDASHLSINEVLSSDGDTSPNGEVDLLQLGGTESNVAQSRRTIHSAAPKRRTSSNKIVSPIGEVQKLSPAQIVELTSSPESLPVRVATSAEDGDSQEVSPLFAASELTRKLSKGKEDKRKPSAEASGADGPLQINGGLAQLNNKSSSNGTAVQPQTTAGSATTENKLTRPALSNRTVSTPPNVRRKSASKTHSALQQAVNDGKSERPIPPPLDLKGFKSGNEMNSLKPTPTRQDMPSPGPSSLPLPPLSLPLYLQLEVSSERPSPLYIHRSHNFEVPFETDEIKFERLLNFLRLPQQLESVLGYGALTCLDSFLYMFTILPLRFLKAISILIEWALQNLAREARDISGFIYLGLPRLWTRQHARRRAPSIPKKELEKLREQLTPLNGQPVDRPGNSRRTSAANGHLSEQQRKSSKISNRGHKRTRSTPSGLGLGHKADLLKGFLVIASCAILLRFDASRMYHSIRGQAAIKLYVIYNVLEVADRLLSAVGQDILECLFSSSVLARDSNGRSLVWRPFWMFCLALIYNVVHATALFYQVITLNVAVNSYSNALLTLLMSNQFVEIKGTVFKKFEKENLFQLTCADIVERFQLWLMLTIIALRNIVEVGNLSISLSSILGSSTEGSFSNDTAAPMTSTSILPKALTVLPNWAGEVLGPFLIVLGSEMFVDWLKHAYISKFNNTKPDIYGRFLDVIAKDYYTHAFAEQNLTKRLGLPVLPLACLFIRAASQTYHMFLATHMPLPIPSTATAVSVESATASSADTTAALAHIDQIFRRALGRSSFGGGAGADSSALLSWPSVDDVIALTTMLAFFLLCFFVLLAAKLLLGMALLSLARRRYKTMKERERGAVDTEGRRVGGWGVVEVDEEKRRWIYKDDEKGLDKIRARDERAKREAREARMPDLMGVDRYQMVAKRIW